VSCRDCLYMIYMYTHTHTYTNTHTHTHTHTQIHRYCVKLCVTACSMRPCTNIRVCYVCTIHISYARVCTVCAIHISYARVVKSVLCLYYPHIVGQSVHACERQPQSVAHPSTCPPPSTCAGVRARHLTVCMYVCMYVCTRSEGTTSDCMYVCVYVCMYAE